MSKPNHFKLNQPFVVSELIDGDAVVMTLKSGNYYSARHTGALLWAWLERGMPLEDMASGLAGIYGGEASAYASDVHVFFDNLVEQGLDAPANSSTDSGSALTESNPTAPKTYKPPVLEVYADMQDLLLLDPIRDTDEGGWPVAKPTRSTAP